MMRGATGTVRMTHKLNDGWQVQGSLGEQRLKTDDSTAFPFGGTLCFGPTPLYCDRFSPEGQFDVYDFRSKGESRVTRSADVHIDGSALHLGTTVHKLAVGLQRTLVRVHVPTAAFTYVGTGDISGNFSAPEGPLYTSAQNLRDERSTEFYVRDSIRLNDQWQAWAGLRHTRLTRAQTPSDGSEATSKAQENLTTPWLALGYQFMPQHQAYVSWGEGIELPLAKFSTPFVSYTNSGAVLPAQKSRQWEVGVKGQQDNTNWSINYFRIVKPEASSLFNGTGYDFAVDGNALHQGLEGRVHTRISDYTLDLSAMVMDAERRGSAKPGVNGKAPVNVPDHTLKMSHGWRVSALPGLNLQADIVYEGERTADAVNELRIPAWTRVDLGLGYTQQAGQTQAITWRLGVSNLFNTRAWVESPTQFDHIYLFPMAERTVTASMQLSF
jgi:iron complex outermembrane receptor protein